MITRIRLFITNVVYFSVFGTSAILMRFICFPCMRLFWHGEELTKQIRHLVSASFRLFWSVAKLLRFLDHEVHGIEKLKQDQGAIIIANHPTYIDYVLLASLMPEINCLVKEEVLHKPALGGIVKNTHYLINSDGPSLLKECENCLKRGENILIFPEGTRTPHNGEIKLKKGFASLASHLLCPVRVVTISCSEHFLDKQMKWYEVPPRIPKFTVDIHEVLDPRDFKAELNPHHAAEQIKHAVAQIFIKTLQQHDLGNSNVKDDK